MGLGESGRGPWIKLILTHLSIPCLPYLLVVSSLLSKLLRAQPNFD
jgi:hypothetical protein